MTLYMKLDIFFENVLVQKLMQCITNRVESETHYNVKSTNICANTMQNQNFDIKMSFTLLVGLGRISELDGYPAGQYQSCLI